VTDDPFAILDGVDLSSAPSPREQLLMVPYWLRGGLRCVAFAVELEALYQRGRNRRNFLEIMAGVHQP
jgi:hypothetical protein